MHENDRSAADGSPNHGTALGRAMASARARHRPEMDAGAALAAVLGGGRGTTPCGLCAVPAPSAEIKDGVLGAGAPASGMFRPDLPPRPHAHARRAPGDRKRPAPADAPARRHRRDGQTGPARHGSSRPCQDPSGRLLCLDARSAADPHGDAGRRADRSTIILGALHGLARTLDPYVQGWLSRLLDLRIPAVRIHTGQAADATARRFNADAVSFGPDIMFRAGRFAPDSATGLGLLGHELTHVAHTQLDRSAGPRPRRAGREEVAAIENERRVLQHATEKPALAVNVAAMPRGGTIPRRDARAGAARRVGRPGGGASPGDSDVLSASPELSAQQLGALQGGDLSGPDGPDPH